MEKNRLKRLKMSYMIYKELPDMDDIEITRIIKSKSENKDVVVIALTAYAMKGD